MPPKTLTPEQEADKKLANSLRTPLSFAQNSPITMANSTPAIMAQPRPVQPSTPNIFTNIGNVVGGLTKKLGVFDYSNPDLQKPLSFDKQKLQGIGDTALNFTPMGMTKVVKPILSGVAKEAKPVFQGLKDLSTSIVEKLKGRTIVSKQFISDLTKGAEVKLSEKNIINNVLESSPDNISVADFAKKVQDELLPLKRITTTEPGSINAGRGQTTRLALRYEDIALPAELRGEVSKYLENLYNSPIKTSAGGVHFTQKEALGYFGHTRIEDMADNSTRRVIEVQSDLYQKGGLERESQTYGRNVNYKGKEWKIVNENPDSLVLARKGEKNVAAPKSEIINTDLKKLQQYNDPTAHYRMMREEIKKAAEDGKTKLQFPTGETAMKIEGLGQIGGHVTPWTIRVKGDWGGIDATKKLLSENMKVGQEVGRMGVLGEADSWIITDVLGDGKFKAVPKEVFDDAGITKITKGDIEYIAEMSSHRIETFDISGKVDQNNPIYKFYDKEVRKFLNKFGGKEIVDDKGVKWIEIPITKEQAKEPVQAFGKARVGAILGGAGVAGALFTAIGNPKKESVISKQEQVNQTVPAIVPQFLREDVFDAANNVGISPEEFTKRMLVENQNLANPQRIGGKDPNDKGLMQINEIIHGDFLKKNFPHLKWQTNDSDSIKAAGEVFKKLKQSSWIENTPDLLVAYNTGQEALQRAKNRHLEGKITDDTIRVEQQLKKLGLDWKDLSESKQKHLITLKKK